MTKIIIYILKFPYDLISDSWRSSKRIAPVELVDAVDSIRTVPPDGGIVRVGRALGISFGGG